MDVDGLVETTRKRLVCQRGRVNMVAEIAGVSYSWASKFARGKVRNPTVRQLSALSVALDQIEAKDAA